MKTLMDFPKLQKMTGERYKAAQIPDRDQSQVIILPLESISSKEGLQIDKCRSNYNAPMIYKQNGLF